MLPPTDLFHIRISANRELYNSCPSFPAGFVLLSNLCDLDRRSLHGVWIFSGTRPVPPDPCSSCRSQEIRRWCLHYRHLETSHKNSAWDRSTGPGSMAMLGSGWATIPGTDDWGTLGHYFDPEVQGPQLGDQSPSLSTLRVAPQSACAENMGAAGVGEGEQEHFPTLLP